MGIGRHVAQYGSTRLARRLGRSVPLIGAAIVLLTLRHAIRRKGLRGGITDSALDATPFVGAIKNVYEILRGDIIPDRAPTGPVARRRGR